MTTTKTNLLERIEFDEATLCWNWKGYVRADGYGILKIKSVKYRAHRVSYETFVGPIPDGLHLDHLCSNRKYVNPVHLQPVTIKENYDRSNLCNSSITHCPKGHPYSGENLYTAPSGRRSCRTCRYDQNLARQS